MKIKNIDRLLLYYPFVIYALIGLLFLSYSVRDGSIQPLNRLEVQWSSLLAFVVFGNFAHNFMSFWQIIRVPEFKMWSNEYSFCKLTIWQIIAIVFLFFYGLIHFMLPYGFNTFTMVFGDNLIVNLVVFFFFTINTHHNLSQSKGIGFSHNFNFLKSTPQNLKESLHKKETQFYQYLMIDWFFYIGWLRFSNRENFILITTVRSIFLLIAFYALIKTYLKLPKEDAKLKIIFSARHFYRLFFSLHSIFIFLAYAIHGADAMITYWKSVEKSESKNSFFLKIEFIAFFILLSILYIFLYQIHKPSDFIFVTQILVSLFLTHYVVEGFLYRFRNPITKKYILQLL